MLTDSGVTDKAVIMKNGQADRLARNRRFPFWMSGVLVFHFADSDTEVVSVIDVQNSGHGCYRHGCIT